jgi:hypothetical protein
VIAAIAAVAAWVAVLVWVIRRIVAETGSSPVARLFWIVVVIAMPVVGPVLWAFVRWQLPAYAGTSLSALQ